ncbi:ATP-binding cassette domain-containing protein [Roseimarinus sediminis]|uniref:ATP-binding cassette domain-containing protein n=1 Tax=Roseimarinus sediminis TaxID=1610899 RepID=UPI003D1ECAD9
MSDHVVNGGFDRRDVLFHIEKLSCAYTENQPVLEAEDLIIPKRKITVLLGPSGAGKSTLLETLGLMTQTVNGSTSCIRFFPNDTDEYDLAGMWGDHQEAQRYHIRMLYYSFIFQSTNLMPNFSALENVGLTELIQNKPESEAYFNAIESLVKNLSVTSLAYEKKPYEFSGGERQRLAFARAINPDFTVLFGDEPTGNLDHFNSVKLMHFIRDFITRQRENASAIIVSHNIPLTLDFADRIIVMSKRENGVSIIDPHFIYDRERIKWYESKEKQQKVQQEIELLLNSDTESYVRILMHLSEHKVDEGFFELVKSRMTAHQTAMEADKAYPEEEQKAFRDWLTAELEEKEIANNEVKEHIRQFAFGEIKKADIKINDVIRTIQDLKFKTAVEGQRDKKRTKNTGIEQQELGNSNNPVASILGFIPWLVLSLAPFITTLINRSAELIHRGFKRVVKPVLPVERNDDDSFNPLLFSFRDIIPVVFYKLCVAWDWVNVKYKLFIKFNLKQHWIPFNTIPHDFKHLFYRNETKELLGKKNKHFWLIVVILFFTFLAIGFSNGSLEYLREKMEDPFVRSINAPIPGTNRNANRAIAYYNADSLQQIYHYDSIVGYNKWTAYFQGDLSESPNRSVDGRSIPFDDPLVATIVDPKVNRSLGQGFTGERDISIIVTRNLLNKLECSETPAFIFKKQRDGRLTPIPVRAVVDRLPGERIDFLTTQHFYNNYISMGDRFLFKDNNKLYAYVVMDSTQLSPFKEAADSFFTRYYDEGGLLEVNTIDVYAHQYSYQPMYVLQVSFFNSEYISLEQIDELYAEFRTSDELTRFVEEAGIEEHQFIQSYFPNQENRTNGRFDYIAVNFNDLSNVDEFAEKFAEDSEIKLEMSKIEQMKNYNFVSKLTTIMSLILIGFSVLMINIFLSNILSTHLNKIKMNIGTFKAFGIDIKRIYMGMMYIFVLLPLVLALFLAGVLGYLGLIYFIINVLSPFEVEKNLYFDLFNQYTLISVLVLAVVNYYAFSIIINRIFKQTPGDLIYDRNNKA